MSVAITGSPGVGKHTVARGVSRGLGGMPIVDINDIAREEGLLECVGGGGDGDSADASAPGSANDVDTGRLSSMLGKRIEGKERLVVGHLAPYVLDRDQVRAVIILRRDPRDLLAVYNDRGYPDGKAAENVQGEALGIIAYDAMTKFRDRAFQINSTGGIRDAVDRAISVISTMSGGDDTIDWLGQAYDDGRLEEIFGAWPPDTRARRGFGGSEA